MTAETVEVFPWVRSLPAAEVVAFTSELISSLRVAARSNDLSAAGGVIAAWRNTAEIYADADLHETLRQPLDGIDYGSVPCPGET